VVDTEGVNIE